MFFEHNPFLMILEWRQFEEQKNHFLCGVWVVRLLFGGYYSLLKFLHRSYIVNDVYFTHWIAAFVLYEIIDLFWLKVIFCVWLLSNRRKNISQLKLCSNYREKIPRNQPKK